MCAVTDACWQYHLPEARTVSQLVYETELLKRQTSSTDLIYFDLP